MLRRNSAPALIVALLGFLFFGISPASAHDTLISVDPEDGGQVETAPEEAVLTFSGNLMDISPQAVVRQGDTTLESGEVSIHGTDLIVPLPQLDAGDYEIVYSVVSSDGHRIDGLTTFTVTTGTGGGTDGSPGDTEEDEQPVADPDGQETDDPDTPVNNDETATDADEPATDEATDDAQSDDRGSDATTGEEEQADEDSGSATTWIRWGGIIVVVLGLAVIVSRYLRNRE